MILRLLQYEDAICFSSTSSCSALLSLQANIMLHCMKARNCSVQGMSGHAGVASLGSLTALQNLKFDLAHHRSISDDQLRQLSRLRLTSLSLPSLCTVRWTAPSTSVWRASLCRISHLSVTLLTLAGRHKPGHNGESVACKPGTVSALRSHGQVIACRMLGAHLLS